MSHNEDDQKSLSRIHAALGDPKAFITAMYAHYQDADRADRTSRSMLYLHIGQLSGVISRLLDAGRTHAAHLAAGPGPATEPPAPPRTARADRRDDQGSDDDRAEQHRHLGEVRLDDPQDQPDQPDRNQEGQERA